MRQEAFSGNGGRQPRGARLFDAAGTPGEGVFNHCNDPRPPVSQLLDYSPALVIDHGRVSPGSQQFFHQMIVATHGGSH